MLHLPERLSPVIPSCIPGQKAVTSLVESAFRNDTSQSLLLTVIHTCPFSLETSMLGFVLLPSSSDSSDSSAWPVPTLLVQLVLQLC